MSNANKVEQRQAIVEAFERAGWSVAFRQATKSPNPVEFDAWQGEVERISVWAYIWNLTPGGNNRPRSERRVQMTSVDPPLAVNPKGETVILGYDANLDIFAGFDFMRHKIFTKGSPSLQINISTVKEAVSNGLAFGLKTNGEVAVGIRPDQLLNYIRSASELHQWSSGSGISQSMEELTKHETEVDLAPLNLPEERRKVIRTVSTNVRAGNFRKSIIDAYSGRCAITGLQLRVVQAAHILPVSAPGSTDAVQNGIALSPTYHIAYDNGLIFLDDRLNMHLNETKAEELKSSSLHGGLGAFADPLGEIIKPVSRELWPDPKLIEQANHYRGIHS